MTETLDPSAPIQKPEPTKQPKQSDSSSLVDNDNLVLVSLADLKRFWSNYAKMYASDPFKAPILDFIEEFISDIEEDKDRQLEEAQAAMEKFNPVTPVGDV
jgi:hypothetical protein